MELIYAKLQTMSLYVLDGVAYFISAMVGAFVKDMYDTHAGTRPKIEIRRVLIATLLSTLITFAVREHVPEDALPFITFIIGVIGWELFVRISTIEGLLGTIRDIRLFIVSLVSPGTGGVAPPPNAQTSMRGREQSEGVPQRSRQESVERDDLRPNPNGRPTVNDDNMSQTGPRVQTRRNTNPEDDVK